MVDGADADLKMRKSTKIRRILKPLSLGAESAFA